MAITCFKTFTVDSGCNSCDMLVEAESADANILSRMFGIVLDNPVGECANGITTYTADYTVVDSFFWIGGQSFLTSISLPNVTNIAATGAPTFVISDNSALTSVSAPLLSITSGVFSSFRIKNNTSLSSLDLSSIIMAPGKTYDFRNNALTESAVNAILARGAASLPAFTAGSLLLQDGFNAAPTGQGLIDKAAIASNGNVCNTN